MENLNNLEFCLFFICGKGLNPNYGFSFVKTLHKGKRGTGKRPTPGRVEKNHPKGKKNEDLKEFHPGVLRPWAYL
jgi:hypothetical protein